MKKIVFMILLTFCCSKLAWAEIQNYTLTDYEFADEYGATSIKPIYNTENKSEKLTQTLTLAGLGTNQVTAQSANWGLAQECQVYPMDKSNNTGVDGSRWYYILHSNGVIIIELKGEKVKLHNLGLVKYTLVGTLDRGIQTGPKAR